MKRADKESNQANKKTLKSRKPLLQDLSSCSTMTPQGRFLEGAGTVAPRVCRCPFGCSRQIDGRYPHAVFCYTCGPRSKHLPEDPCRCAEAGAICCAADPDNDQDRSAPPLPPQGRFLEGCKAKEMCSTPSSYLASAEQRSSNSALLTDSGLPEDSSGALQSQREAPARRLRFKQPAQARSTGGCFSCQRAGVVSG